MSGACSTHGKDDRSMKNSGRKNWREETTCKI